MSDPPAMAFEDSAAPLSDMGNAQVMARWFAGVARWVPSWHRWLTWEEERGLWTPHHGAMQYAQKTAIGLYHIALEGAEETAGELRRVEAGFGPRSAEAREARASHAPRLARVRWYVKSQMIERTRAIVQHAASLPDFHANPDDFDDRPYLLSTPSGTVDLLTGALRPPAKGDLLTKITAVPYIPDAPCPTWNRFLLQVMCGDEELVAYLQRISGYCLTGSTEEHFLGFFYGDGANGKSTFLNLLSEVAGDYYSRAPRGLLFWAPFEKHPTELATLFKRRLVICSEVEEGAKLDEAKVKDLTGGDRISCRRMREDYWDFAPTHKLLIAGNHWFFVRGQDEGIWRRIHIVPWRMKLDLGNVDTDILRKLREELPGILAWAVRGAAEWRRKGLAEPASCARIRDQFRSESDLFQQWWTEAIVADTAGRLPCENLYHSYLDWMHAHNHAEVLGRRHFTKRVRERGPNYTPGTVWVNGRDVRGWTGLRLATAEERASRRWGTEAKPPEGGGA